MYNILYNPIDKINELQLQQFNCNDTATISRINESKVELYSFLTYCIDPNNVELVEKLHEMDSKLIKLRCEMSDEDVKEFHQMIVTEDIICEKESALQIASCIFSEPEVIEMSKNVSKAVKSTSELFGGNDKQCGILNRIAKCIQNSRKNCERSLSSKLNEFNTLMKMCDCKIDETFEVS
ncbi:unnamed protein product [Diamesa serratosioi]